MDINTSIVQGSVLRPTLFNINSSTLQPLSYHTAYCKYDEDGYLVLPGHNCEPILLESEHHSRWAAGYNLKPNVSKEMKEYLKTELLRLFPPLLVFKELKP